MKKNLKYISIFLISFGIFVAFQYLKPTPLDWRVSLDSRDKIPYGTFVLDQTIESFFNGSITKTRETLYETLTNSDSTSLTNYLIIAQGFHPDKPEVGEMLQKVKSGSNFLITANRLGDELLDTLGIRINYPEDYIESFWLDLSDKRDSTKIIMKSSDQSFYYAAPFVGFEFKPNDSIDFNVIAENEFGNPVAIRLPYGDGSLVFCGIPMAFSNYYLMKPENISFAEAMLSTLPATDLMWSEYYQLGRAESQSPMRVVLSNISLRWAWFITIGSLLLFMFFEAKRRQRIIPIIRPPRNSSVEFAETVGQLYYQKSDHKNLANKMLLHLKERIREQHFVTLELNEDTRKTLVTKCGFELNAVDKLIELSGKIQSANQIDHDTLNELNNTIDNLK
ncbi:MAG: DUF4350 domain-containing protein [Cyclobacteriaceae bacterium]